MQKRIFLVAGGYLPGYKSGGPVRSIVNMVDWLGDEFDFYIMALDRDTGDSAPYSGIKVGEWQQVGKAQVIYLPLRELNIWQWRKILLSQPYDMIYQNSYFDPGSLKSVLLWRFGLIPHKPLMLSPRGEFAGGALSVKQTKKRLFIRISQIARLHRHRDLHWHITNDMERDALNEILGVPDDHIHYAQNMPPSISQNTNMLPLQKVSGEAKLASLARIVPVKNLNFALKVLAQVNQPVQFNIYGPTEDEAYWRECQQTIEEMPAHIKVAYKGTLQGDKVTETLAQYHGLLLPTLSESFGHAILEALTVGCVPIISDQTPWRNLSASHAGWDLLLDEPERFKEAIETLVAMDDPTWQQWSQGARARAQQFIKESDVVDKTRQMFQNIMAGQ